MVTMTNFTASFLFKWITYNGVDANFVEMWDINTPATPVFLGLLNAAAMNVTNFNVLKVVVDVDNLYVSASDTMLYRITELDP